jgi:hypothetical protein
MPRLGSGIAVGALVDSRRNAIEVQLTERLSKLDRATDELLITGFVRLAPGRSIDGEDDRVLA